MSKMKILNVQMVSNPTHIELCYENHVNEIFSIYNGYKNFNYGPKPYMIKGEGTIADGVNENDFSFLVSMYNNSAIKSVTLPDGTVYNSMHFKSLTFEYCSHNKNIKYKFEFVQSL